MSMDRCAVLLVQRIRDGDGHCAVLELVRALDGGGLMCSTRISESS